MQYFQLSSSPKKLSGERARLHLVVLNHKSIDSIGDVSQFANLVRGVHELSVKSIISTIGNKMWSNCLVEYCDYRVTLTPLG